MSLRLEYNHKSGSAGCCVDEFYAVVFAFNQQALKNNGSGTYTLNAFDGGNQDDFAIELAEHAERTRYYYVDLSTFTLPANSLGEYYTVEYWQADVAGTYDRTTDTFLDSRNFLWDGTKFVDSQIALSQLPSAYSTELAVSYDSNTNEMRLIAFLELNGELQSTVTACEFTLVARDGTVIANTSLTSSDFITGMNGVFAWTQASITLSPDEVYAAKVEITDAASAVHTGAAVQVTWD